MKAWPKHLHLQHGSKEEAYNSSCQYVKLEIRKYGPDPWIVMVRKSATLKEEPEVAVGFVPTADEIKQIISHLQAVLECMNEPTDEYEQLIQNYI